MEKIKYFCHLGVIIQKRSILKLFSNRFFSLVLSGLAIVALISACSVNKNKLPNRIYHNLSAHYNGYWNGKESYNEGIRQLKAGLQNNYAEILPVFNYGTEQDAKTLGPNMERAVQKASVVIQKHSMRFKNKEYNRWVDNAYLLIGKSYFYQREFVSARRTFDFMIDKFKSSPASYEAMLWLARTYNQSGQYEKSDPLLKNFQELIDYENVPLSLQREYPLVYANFYLLQKKYNEAINLLIDAIEINNGKQLVTRLKFILAQVYFQQGNLEEASDLFTEVIHRNPEYEMAINARLNRARSFYAGVENANDVITSLKDLLSDPKNDEYHDQIYFVLAEIALKENNQAKAVEYLKKSVALSVTNNFQKVSASLTLADLYFEKGNYQNAKLYYDTAMQVIPLDYPNVQVLKDRTAILVNLVGYLETVQLQDSLQMLARMTEEDRLAVVDGIITDIETQEQKAQAEQSQQMRQMSMVRQQSSFIQNNQNQGAWYFYNTSTLSYGFTEFVSKWGRRPLEDNWRLSNKQVSNTQNVDLSEQAGNIGQAGITETNERVTKKDRNYYLKNIPLTEAQLLESNDKIIEALFQSAMLFKEGLNDNERAITQFESLVNDYPENEYILQSYYYLHQLYAEIDQTKSNAYRQELLSRFPNSDYAKVLINPGYFRNLSDRKSAIQNLYADAYQAFENEQYHVSISLSDRAIANYSDSTLIPKFEYVRALAMGRIEVIDSLMVGMNRVLDKYPQSDIAPLAQSMIDHLSFENEERLRNSQLSGGDEMQLFGDYRFNPNTSHLYILIINTDRVNLEALKLRFSDFNLKRTSSKSLTITEVTVDENKNWVGILGFENMQMAQDYLFEMVADEYVLSIFNPDEYEHFVISENNYVILLRDHNISEYLKFYYKHYQITN